MKCLLNLLFYNFTTTVSIISKINFYCFILNYAEVPQNVPGDISIVLVKTTGFTVSYKQVAESDLPTGYDIYIFDVSTEKGFTKKTSHIRLEGRPQNVKIEGLVADTDYEVRMRATNKVGEGKWSEKFSVKTGKRTQQCFDPNLASSSE